MRAFALALVMLMAQDRRQVLADLESIDLQVGALAAQVAQLDAKAAVIDAERKGHVAVLDAADGNLASRKEQAERRARAVYRLQRRGLARLLFDAEDPVELRRRVRYLLAVIRADGAQTRAYAEQLAERRAAAAKLEADAAALAGVQADLRARIEALDAERARRSALVREIKSRPPLAAQLVEEQSRAAVALERSLPPTASGGDAALFRAEKGRLPSPVAGSLVRGFGAYMDSASGVGANNLGVDYAASLGAPFRAVADGTVSRSGYIRGYGQVVIVQHGAYATLYAHANGLRVAQGQAVRRGDVLGLVGNTGLAEDAEARLHFEVRYNNTPQDPSEWLAH